MKSIVKIAKSVEEAVQEAIKELDVSREDVSIEVIDEPIKGFLGLIGNRDARVRVEVVNDPATKAEKFLEQILNKLKIEARFNINKEDNELYVEVIGKNEKDMGVIIGKRGKTLDSLQYLLSLVVNKGREKYLRVILDTENYRKKREETLIRLANSLAKKALSSRRVVKLEPMNPFERRIIHSALQNVPNITTHSEGQEPFRKVVIEPKK